MEANNDVPCHEKAKDSNRFTHRSNEIVKNGFRFGCLHPNYAVLVGIKDLCI